MGHFKTICLAIALMAAATATLGICPGTAIAVDQESVPVAIEVASADVTETLMSDTTTAKMDVPMLDAVIAPAFDQPFIRTSPPVAEPAIPEPKDQPGFATQSPAADQTAVTPSRSDPEIKGTGEPEAQSEEAEKTPELVGPDDDSLLEEVEKRVNIVPPEPAIKIAEPSYDIPLELNAKVLDYIEIFQTSRRRNFELGLIRSRKYEALIKPIFREYGIPTDLYYLALIESAFNPRAYSYARAMGIWQFIASTGRLYGLRRNEWIDERCDPEKSSRAAARHLKDLYMNFGSWPLVFAAYNAGQGRVQREIAKAGTMDFWSLKLPAQTRNYVPAFYAALIIVKEPERYGFQLEYEESPATEAVEIGGGTRLSLVAALCGTSVDEIRTLNPELRKNHVPPSGKYALSIPSGKREEFLAGLAKVPAGKTTADWSTYRVAPGDTLFSIAKRYETMPEVIREANRLKDAEIRPGDQLTIPGRRTAIASIPKAPRRVTVSSTIPESYRILKGDNPWSIARRFNIPLDDLLAWNGLNTDTVLNVGRTLVLREPDSGGDRTSERRSGTTTYQVRKGDNLWEISRRFETSLDEIRRVNGFGPAHKLQIGDRVIVPSDNL